jgi:hypothetical protein
MFYRAITSMDINDIYLNAPLNLYTFQGVIGSQGPTGADTGDTGSYGPTGIGYSPIQINQIIDASFAQSWAFSDSSKSGLPYNTSFSYMATSSNGQNTIGVVSGGGVYISNNFGINWQLVSGISISANYNYCSSSDDFSHLSVSTASSLYISTNAGLTWSNVSISAVSPSASS